MNELIFDTEKFLKARKRAMLSMDEKIIRAFFREYNNKEMPSGLTFWVSVHKARTGDKLLPMYERAASKWWLHHFGYRAMDDGDVLPPTNSKVELRKYFKRIDKFMARDFNLTTEQSVDNK